MPPHAFEEAFEKVGKLAATFQANEARYLSAEYQEAEARKDFIDKFFIALGWDVNHDQQTNPYEQEVKVEPPVSAAGQRRADYAFHLGPNYRDVRFFVEAKKPYGDIATADNYFQTIRYGWNSDTPLAVLTDFKQFEVLDCRYKPDIDTALNRHVARYHYSEYLDPKKFAEIYWLFSHEAVADGSLEKRAKELPKPRGKAVQHGLFPGGYQSIDESFLKELDEYRTTLARIFKNKNPELDSEALTELAQRTLDRLVFLRFLEDKGIEPQRVVDGFGDKGTAWEDFIAASRRLDGIYNGIVFKHHNILDSDKFRVDDTAFADICERLAHVNSPYDFDAIPIHILGSIYERFLGNVVVATDKRVRVEPKPEVRRARGVYYTPEYIVRYIVENTVGKLIAGKTPTQIAEMRFADIACGSGSFLLGVFDLLLTYHGHYYNENPNKVRNGDCIKHNGKLYLSLRKKREILLKNIYGVDIDAQAVEVCQLSLYLRLLKDESTASAHQYQLEFAHTALMKKLLPDLSKNIVCGNSIIGRDFVGEDEKNINPMDFEDAFPKIFQGGGFDAIVGNPPYVDVKSLSETYVRYVFSTYAASNNRINLFAAFIERALALCKQTGFRFSMIVPGAILTQDSYQGLRKKILRNCQVETIVRLPNESFGAAAGDVKVDTVILVLTQRKTLEEATTVLSYPGYKRISTIDPGAADVCANILQTDWAKSDDCVWSLNLGGKDEAILNKCERDSLPLDYFAEFCLGLTPYDKYKGHTEKQIRDKVFHANSKKNKTFKKLLAGNDVRRYAIVWNKKQWISYGPWLGAPREKRFFTQKRILVKQIIDWTTKRIWAGLTEEELYNTQNAFNLLAKPVCTAEYLLALINSRLMTFYHRKKFLDEFKMRFQKILIKDCRRFPIRLPDLTNPADKTRHEDMVEKVNRMLKAKKQLPKATTDKDKNYYENKCAALDRQIDRLVYEIYGLSEEEIQIVEGQT
jgi:type I restriction-modification system DNA methylase subunit